MSDLCHQLIEAWRDNADDDTHAAQLKSVPPENLTDELRFTAALYSVLADDAVAFRRSLLARLAAECDGAKFQQQLTQRLGLRARPRQPRRRNIPVRTAPRWALATTAVILGAIILLVRQQTPTQAIPVPTQSIPPIARETIPTAIISPVEWIAEVRSGSAHLSDGRIITAPTHLAAGTTLHCEESVIIELKLGATLSFVAGSDLTLAPASDHSVVELRTGSMDAHVVHQPAGQALHIRTAHAEVRVVGTTFRVDAQPDATVVAVREGRVAVTSSADGREQFLDPGQSVTISALSAQVMQSLATSDLTAWNPLRGDWHSDTQALVGTGDAAGSSRIASRASFGAMHLRLEVQSDDALVVELQVADYLVFAEIAGEQVRTWCVVEATYQAGVLTATANGVALTAQAGIANDGRGPISLYTRNGGLRIRNVTVQPLDAAP